MQIIGNGMIAKSLHPHQDQFPDYVVFASGVSNSLEENPKAFEREYDLLYKTLHECREEGHCLLYFSSGGTIYGNYEQPRTESSPVFPLNAYGRHKLFCEAIIERSGVDYLILRLPQLVGSKQNPNQLVSRLVEQACAGHAKIYDWATRDLLDVDDLMRIINHILVLRLHNETLVVASGYSVSVRHIFDEIQLALATNAEITTLERGDRQQYDISKLKRLIPDELTFTSDYYKTIIHKYAHQLANTATGQTNR